MPINSHIHLDVFGGLWVEERCSAVLEEESSCPLAQASHGLGAESPHQQVCLSLNEPH